MLLGYNHADTDTGIDYPFWTRVYIYLYLFPPRSLRFVRFVSPASCRPSNPTWIFFFFLLLHCPSQGVLMSFQTYRARENGGGGVSPFLGWLADVGI